MMFIFVVLYFLSGMSIHSCQSEKEDLSTKDSVFIIMLWFPMLVTALWDNNIKVADKEEEDE